MTISNIYTGCKNIEAECAFLIYEDEDDYYREENAVIYNSYETLPYGYFRLREIDRFAITDDGFAVHILFVPENK